MWERGQERPHMEATFELRLSEEEEPSKLTSRQRGCRQSSREGAWRTG